MSVALDKHRSVTAMGALLLVVVSFAALTVCASEDPERLPGTAFRGRTETVLDVTYSKQGSDAQKLDIIRPRGPSDKPMPVLVYIHGGAWAGGDKKMGAMLLAPYARKGYFCVSINYRLVGEAIFPAQIEDCKCAIRYLRAHAKKYNIDPDRIGVWGSSAGGHLAALLGTAGDVEELEGKGGWNEFSSGVQAVCDWYGPSDLMRMGSKRYRGRAFRRRKANAPESRLIGGTVDEKRDLARAASPVTHVSKDDPPFLIMHGTEDPLVPYEQSEILARALRKAGVPVELVPVEGAGHGGVKFFTADMRRKVAGFFDTHLMDVER
jgi:acetyl esterase/lipase